MTVYLSSLRLALGCEFVYQRAGSEMQDAMLSVGGYYRTDTWEVTARLGIHSWAIGYQHQFKDKLMLMADLEGSLVQVRVVWLVGHTNEMVGYIGLQYRVQSACTNALTLGSIDLPFFFMIQH